MDLAKGAKGPAVVTWQQFLNTRKIKVSVDGDFGKLTEDATRLWQSRAGIPVNGILDTATIEAAKTIGNFAPYIGEKPVKVSVDEKLDLFDGDTKLERINNAKLAGVSPTLQKRGRLFISAAKADGWDVQIVQGMRTFAEQNALYAIGRTKPGRKVTNAIGGQSLHNYGLALDFAPVVNGQISWEERLYKPFRVWAEQSGLEWGGTWRFVDLPHVQDDEGMSLAQVQKIYRTEGLAGVWAKVT